MVIIYIYIYIYIYIISRRSITTQRIIHSSMSLDGVQSQCYLYVPDEGSLLPKYIDCTTSNEFEIYIYISSHC